MTIQNKSADELYPKNTIEDHFKRHAADTKSKSDEMQKLAYKQEVARLTEKFLPMMFEEALADVHSYDDIAMSAVKLAKATIRQINKMDEIE